MMDKEKPKTPQEAPAGTLNTAIADLAEVYSYGEILDALESFYKENGEEQSAEMAKKHAKEFRDFLGPDVDSPSEEYSKIESIANDEGKTISEVVRSWLTKAAIDHLQSKIDDLKERV